MQRVQYAKSYFISAEHVSVALWKIPGVQIRENHRLIISVIFIYVCLFVVNLLFYAHRIRILGHIVIWMTDCGEALHYSHFKLPLFKVERDLLIGNYTINQVCLLSGKG